MEKGLLIWIGIIIALAIISVALVMNINFKNPTGDVVNIQEDIIKIGFIAPLSGDLAFLGNNMQKAVELAKDQINEKGGINGKKIKVIYEDGKCDGKEAVSAAQKLINIYGVNAIIGGLCSAETLAVAPLAESSKTILMSPCSSAPKISQAGDYIFRDYISDLFQGKYGADFAYNELGKRKAALFFVQADYGIGVKNAFKERFKELGGEIVAEESFDQSSRDYRTQLTKIRDKNSDIIFFVGYTEEIIPGLKQIKELGINSQILGTEVFEDTTIFDRAGDSAEGVIYYVVKSPLSEEFKEEMKKRIDGDVTVCAPQAYDAFNIITSAMKKVGTNREKVKEELYNVKDYNGVSGILSFDENGDIVSADMVVKQIRNKEAVLYR